MKINEDVRKVMMAGLGALSVLAEKTQETVESLAQKGEEALDHGQVLNERLRYKIKQAIHDEKAETKSDKQDVLNALDRLSPDELREVKEKLKALRHDGD